jgi:Flp pilus assembly protein TadB|tara:strand:- start:276 stop:680 length:405 start_codon:yes stop_codon:yes gene_type:complete
MPEKYRDEIEEILKRAGEVAPPRSAQGAVEKHPEDQPREVRPAPKAPSAWRGANRRWPSVTPGKMLLAGLILFVVAALLGLGPLIWVGLILLVVAYLRFFVSPRSISVEKRWRGRTVDEVSATPWDRLKRWLKK